MEGRDGEGGVRWGHQTGDGALSPTLLWLAHCIGRSDSLLVVLVDWEMVDWSVVMMTCKLRCLAPGPSRPWSRKRTKARGGLAN